MPVFQTFRRLASSVTAAALAAALLAACSSTPQAPRPCPDIRIPTDSAQLTRFKPGPGRDLIDVLHEEKVLGFSHRCEYDVDETGSGELLVELAPQLRSSIGPASADNRAQFEYFVAITDDAKTVLEKARFPVEIKFPENKSRVEWQREDPIVMRIPLESGKNGNDFQIYLGLQLTQEELQYQRQNR